MCPSYIATGDERHTTRARANALRIALSNRGLLEGLDDPALVEVMDLCLSCKACKSECPTGVDVARMKAEWLGVSQPDVRCAEAVAAGGGHAEAGCVGLAVRSAEQLGDAIRPGAVGDRETLRIGSPHSAPAVCAPDVPQMVRSSP